MGLESLPREALGCLFSAAIVFAFVTAMNNARVKEHKSIFGFAVFWALVKLFSVYYWNSVFCHIEDYYEGRYISLWDIILLVFSQEIILLIILMAYSALLCKCSTVRRCILSAVCAQAVVGLTDYLLPFLPAAIYRVHIGDFLYHGGSIRLLTVCITNIFAFILLALIAKFIKKASFSLVEWICNIILPASAAIIFWLMFNYYFTHVLATSSEDYSAAVLATLLIYIAVYAFIISAVFTNRKKHRENMLLGIIELERKRSDDIMQSSQQMKKLRHDIKNLLLPINMELDSGNIDNAKKMLCNIIDSANDIGERFNTGSRTADYILNAKLGNTGTRKIIVSGDAFCLNRINDSDFSVILGNILDNALEATEKIDGGIIELSFFKKDFTCNIVCKNSIVKSVLAENPKLETSKKDKNIHGFGITSVKKIADDYSGTVTCFEENDMFGIHFMIPSE